MGGAGARIFRRATCALLLAAASDAGQSGPAPANLAEIIPAIKQIQEELGFERTGNFLHHSEKLAAYFRCYYTGKLELPASYEQLELREGSKEGCSVDESKHDIFFYPIEAVASGKNPVTASLADASLERVLVVVPHEDFHQQKAVARLPAAITEAASTLAGFVTAGELARRKFGEESEVYRKLKGEAELFLQKASIVNRYYPELRGLYESVRARKMDRERALAGKSRVFAEIEAQCSAIPAEGTTFNKCLSVSNNAGLAFDWTYTKHYPLFHELYVSRGRDPRATIQAIQQVLASGSRSEQQAVQRIRDWIRQAKSAGQSRMGPHGSAEPSYRGSPRRITEGPETPLE